MEFQVNLCIFVYIMFKPWSQKELFHIWKQLLLIKVYVSYLLFYLHIIKYITKHFEFMFSYAEWVVWKSEFLKIFEA